MLIVGLTGGIGSGKTTVARLFSEMGVPIIDADQLARHVVKPEGAAFRAIVEHFGRDVVAENGHLNRARLREIVFSNPEKRLWLEHLLHPLIHAEIRKQLLTIHDVYCILVIPLLVEVGLPYDPVNRVLIVDVPEKNQIERTQKRDGLACEEVIAIIKSQASRAQRLQVADDVIVNDGGLEKLKDQVKKLHEQYLMLGKRLKS